MAKVKSYFYDGVLKTSLVKRGGMGMFVLFLMWKNLGFSMS